MRRFIVSCIVFGFAVLSACDSTPPPTPGTTSDFDLHADFSSQDNFYALPYPSDLRLTSDGTPDLRSFPNPLNEAILEGLRTTGMQRKGWPQMPSAYFHFSAPITAQDPTKIIAADKASPILLVDVDAKSPERGTLYAVVAGTPAADRYLLDDVLEIAPRVGIVLHESRTYAFVVMKSLADATGAKLAAPDAFTALESATAPAANPELAAWNLYQPLWQTLSQIGVAQADVATATVFTTGDVVQDTADLTSKMIAQYTTSIAALNVPTGGDQSRFCEVLGTISYPQFQQGTAPFDTQGLFQFGSDGLPIKQRDEVAPIAISLPKNAPMPAGGYPFIIYFHGSGGLSTAVIDAGPLQSPTDEVGTPGQGPAYVMAPHGFAMAGSALPLNPERVPGATELEYLNFNNPASFRDTFRQGIIEQRMFIDALTKLTIDPSTVASCTGLALPNGETAYHFNMTPLHAQGQSMGGMYTNLVGATDPRVKVVVPTGAGGYWPFMVLTTQTIPNAPNDLKLLLGTGDLTFMHPALHMLETAWEPAEPFVYMRRMARDPLPNHPSRPVYDPCAIGDTYFSTEVYDGASLAYGNREAGEQVWPTMQSALALQGLDGIVPYPVSQDLTAADGTTKYTGAIVQYNGDGIADPHAIYRQLDAVKYQYACFHESFQKTGTATLYAPQPIDSACGP
ncbi:MAG TPA: hypothetical protein VH054_15140 [Polyangiaceae bacterium]|jgi:hypothetical protein|nr:hypothetical protein [Polyangiaceae bacterium]